MNIAVIQYNAGNIQSVLNALERLGVSAEVTGDAEKISSADKVIFPGVGEASSAMASLRENKLVEVIQSLKQPVLGICVGMQLLTDFSEEGNSTLTGIIPLKTIHFEGSTKLKVPHTGWNKVEYVPNHQLFNGISPIEYFYFVHSFFIEFNPKFTIASTEYGVKFSAVIQKDNFYGVQFHPEKSGLAGEQLLKNFSMI